MKNPEVLFPWALTLIVGYCFFGEVGLGFAALFILIMQVV